MPISGNSALGRRAARWLCLAVAAGLTWTTVARLAFSAESNPSGFLVFTLGGSLVVLVGLHAIARRCLSRRSPATELVVLIAVAALTDMFWPQATYGSVAALWSVARGHHSEQKGFITFPQVDRCHNGHMVFRLPLVFNTCVGGRVGPHSDEYYDGYYTTVEMLYSMRAKGTDC